MQYLEMECTYEIFCIVIVVIAMLELRLIVVDYTLFNVVLKVVTPEDASRVVFRVFVIEFTKSVTDWCYDLLILLSPDSYAS